MGSQHPCDEQDFPDGPLSQVEPVQDSYLEHDGFEDECDVFAESRDDADFEAARALGLLG